MEKEINIETKEICNKSLNSIDIDDTSRLDYLFGAIDAVRNDYGSNKERDGAYKNLTKIANIYRVKIELDSFGVPFVKK